MGHVEKIKSFKLEQKSTLCHLAFRIELMRKLMDKKLLMAKNWLRASNWIADERKMLESRTKSQNDSIKFLSNNIVTDLGGLSD